MSNTAVSVQVNVRMDKPLRDAGDAGLAAMGVSPTQAAARNGLGLRVSVLEILLPPAPHHRHMQEQVAREPPNQDGDSFGAAWMQTL